MILTGNSGTGKTRIAKQFAEYMKCQSGDGGNMLLVPVGADWTDNTKILGYFNPIANGGEGMYIKTDILKFIERANANPDIPFFLILDEMNLSHVERYFSDFLSKMETPEDSFKIDNYGVLKFPDNLFVTGTVNIDETTYMFSPKVLDRANVIEFKPDLDSVLGLLSGNAVAAPALPAAPGVAEGFLKLAREIRRSPVPQEMEDDLGMASGMLKSFYIVLEKFGFEFAYRTTKEIRLYAVAARQMALENSGIAITDIVDIQILQKILPKIHGNKKQIGGMLDDLEKLCIEKGKNEDGIEGTGWTLPLSRKKIGQMKDRLERFQYASFI